MAVLDFEVIDCRGNAFETYIRKCPGAVGLPLFFRVKVSISFLNRRRKLRDYSLSHRDFYWNIFIFI